jgi:hypothetical protein
MTYRECEICGRPIRTGTKYCYACRSLGRSGEGRAKPSGFQGIGFPIMLLFISIVSFGFNIPVLGVIFLILAGFFFWEVLKNQERVTREDSYYPAKVENGQSYTASGKKFVPWYKRKRPYNEKHPPFLKWMLDDWRHGLKGE